MTNQPTKKSALKAIAQAYLNASLMMYKKNFVINYPTTRCDTTEEVDGRHRNKN